MQNFKIIHSVVSVYNLQYDMAYSFIHVVLLIIIYLLESSFSSPGCHGIKTLVLHELVNTKGS